MLPQRLDLTLAFKAVALSVDLTGTEKRVAVAIIDSFNRETGQCDPSLNRIGHLVAVSRRTAIRAVSRLEKLRFVIKTRHGGNSHRNSYEPNWVRFREIEARWSAHKKTRHWQPDLADLSPSVVPESRHVAGGADGTQTILNNQSNLTLAGGRPFKSDTRPRDTSDRKWLSGQQERSEGRASPSPRNGMRALAASRAAARIDAERNWNSDLLNRLVTTPDRYADAIAAIDSELQNTATEAELKRTGEGLVQVLAELQRRGLKL